MDIAADWGWLETALSAMHLVQGLMQVSHVLAVKLRSSSSGAPGVVGCPVGGLSLRVQLVLWVACPAAGQLSIGRGGGMGRGLASPLGSLGPGATAGAGSCTAASIPLQG